MRKPSSRTASGMEAHLYGKGRFKHVFLSLGVSPLTT
jgi:hypothetical protein